MTNQALGRAIKIAGSQAKLGEAIGRPQSTISFWLTGAKGGVPGEWCRLIEVATGVPRHELRPDIFDSPLPEAEVEAAA